MEIIRLWAVVISVTTLEFLVVDSIDCDYDSVNKVCLKNYESEVPVNESLFQDRDQKRRCNAMGKFKDCLESSGCHVIPAVQPIYEGFRAGLKFACSEKNTENEDVESCWRSFGFRNAEIFCEKIVRNETTNSEDTACEQKNDFLACIVKSVDKCCGAEAARYTSEAIVAMTSPLLKMMRCEVKPREGVAEIDKCGAYVQPPESPSNSNAGTIAVIVVVVLVVIFGVVVAVVVLVRRYRMAEWLRV